MSHHWEAFHFAARPSGRGRYHRACDSRIRYRLPNEDTDTTALIEVSCLRCQRTRAFQDALTKGKQDGSV